MRTSLNSEGFQDFNIFQVLSLLYIQAMLVFAKTDHQGWEGTVATSLIDVVFKVYAEHFFPDVFE